MSVPPQAPAAIATQTIAQTSESAFVAELRKAAVITGTTDRHMRKAVVRLRASAASQSASDISATSSSASHPADTEVMPTLFTSTSTRPGHDHHPVPKARHGSQPIPGRLGGCALTGPPGDFSVLTPISRQ
jgi:hypothetical protein